MKRLRQEHDERRQATSLAVSSPLSHFDLSFPIGFDGFDVPYRVDHKARIAHELIIGASNLGKSRFMEHHVRHDIRKGHGVCVIDPHGRNPDSVFNNLLRWIKAEGFDELRTVRIIDLSDPAHVTSLNPFYVPPDTPDPDPYVLADTLMQIFERVWNEPFIEKPLIYRLLRAIFVGLFQHDLTLADVGQIFGRAGDPDFLRRDFIANLSNSDAQIALEGLADLTETPAGRRDYLQQVMGPLNRLARFTDKRAIKRMFSGGGEPLDLRRVMDDREILLVNIAPDGNNVDRDVSLLMGTWLMREFTRLCSLRQHHDRRFFLYIDEAADYLSGDVATILDTSRKEGLSLVLALQRLGQLRKAGDDIYNAVLTNPNIYSVFGGLEIEEAKIMVDNMVALELERPVQATIRPTHTGKFETVSLKSASHSDGEAAALMLAKSTGEQVSSGSATVHSTSAGGSTGSTGSLGQTVTGVDANGMPIVIEHASQATSAGYSDMEGWGTVESSSHGYSTAETSSQTASTNSSNTTGTSETLKPEFENMVSGVHPLETVRYAAALAFRQLPARHFFVSVNRGDAIRLAVPTIEAPPVGDQVIADFKAALFDADPAVISTIAVDRELKRRRHVIRERLDFMPMPGDPTVGRDVSDDEPEEFIDPEQQVTPEGDNIVPFPKNDDNPDDDT
ncbi:MAG: hypothetical protein APF80_12350 [Alphaproteobacteria bacterium BRH_c36]|nr:MAG: hypothetical protein APF80_12350 [Alphaproteobacteria bacterium BRH_c36]